MDRKSRAANAVKALYQFKNSGNPAPFIKEVCQYFDAAKNSGLTDQDLSFLLFLANEAGIPHYYDLLEKQCELPSIQEENMTLLSLGAYIHDSSLLVDADNSIKLHRYQKEVLSQFNPEKRNRFILTAPTSFGKTYIIYELIRKMKYRNILLIFPSISLLSENFLKLSELERFSQYKIHTLSESEFKKEDSNIFIFTPERYLSFLDKHQGLQFDFSFVDEVYKIDNSFILDQETTGENERDVAYRVALNYNLQFFMRYAVSWAIYGIPQ